MDFLQKNLESEIKQKSKKVDKLKIELDEKISTFTKKTDDDQHEHY